MSSYHLPRRVKDLPKLEDFNTPQKSENKKLQGLNNSNKENMCASKSSTNVLGSGTKSSFSFTSLGFPKRSSELPTLESDSEDEEKNDHLNCAILNESFIMESPARIDISGGSSVRKLDSSNNSFLMKFNQMAINADNKTGPLAAEISNSLIDDKNVTANSASSLDKVKPNDGTLKRFASHPPSQPYGNQKSMETPLKAITAGTGISALSTIKEPQFVTPQVRPFSVQRSQTRDLCSTNTQKTRSAIVNEFRSQKVLFQTPMSVARPPISCLPNDSISLSLCDTINEGNTPSTIEKIQPPADKEIAATSKSKKSLEDAFQKMDQNDEGKPLPPKNIPQSKPAEKVSANDNNTVSTTNGNEPILYINKNAYIIGRKLGCGGSSSVHLAVSKKLQKECALKIVDLRGDAATVEGYLNETKLLAKLQGNACVVTLFDYQLLNKESRLYMVMEKGDSDLNKILQSYTTNLPLYVLINYLYQMLQAVNYIHQNGVIHSDLKPANFLMVNGRLKLIDFGIASNISIDSTSIIKSSQAGTFNYISPEALTDTSTGSSPMRNSQPKIKISTKSDVWSLGCILYLFLYKKTPFNHIKNIYAKISAISNPEPNIQFPELPTYYPIMLVQMVRNCLQHNPKKRPSCAELLMYPFDMIVPVKHLELRTAPTVFHENTMAAASR